jgi:hypothetical protein
MRLTVALLALVLSLPVGARASSPEQLYRQFGLFGAWARECGMPAATDNPHVSVSEPNPGVILEDQHLGPDYAINRYSVLSARRLSGTELEVTALFHPGAANEERQQLIFAVHDRTRRTMYTAVIGGPVRVKHGIALWNHSKTPILQKCE